MSFTVGIIGGGIAGSTITIKLSQIGIKSILFEASNFLVNGPPMCHLHAGGALYPDIPTEDCIKLLKQSIDTLKCYKYVANLRPTLLTVPTRDDNSPENIINRMKIIRKQYQKLVQQDKSNQVLGKPENYFKVFTKEEVYKLREMDIPKQPKTEEEWMITPAKFLNLQKFKFPFIMVQQYGLSSFRVGAFANLYLEKAKICQLMLNTRVTDLYKTEDDKWIVSYKKNQEENQNQIKVDFIINACGYQTGKIDDMANFKQKRFLQIKAAYVAKWNQCQGAWPEVIIHGKRKTPQGMAQFTPYANGYFQIHGMTEEITLFKEGLAESNDASSHPHFRQNLQKLVQKGWQSDKAIKRTRKAIDFVSEFIPIFRTASQTNTPLWGVQQIPGKNPDLRAAQISFEGNNYARAQIVKASTAIHIAQELIKKIKAIYNPLIHQPSKQLYQNISLQAVVETAKKIAKFRNYPQELAELYQ